MEVVPAVMEDIIMAETEVITRATTREVVEAVAMVEETAMTAMAMVSVWLSCNYLLCYYSVIRCG